VPKRSISLPKNGETAAEISILIAPIIDKVALSQPNSSRIGLKNRLVAEALIRNNISHEMTTIYQP